jgi:hypothetical protein
LFFSALFCFVVLHTSKNPSSSSSCWRSRSMWAVQLHIWFFVFPLSFFCTQNLLMDHCRDGDLGTWLRARWIIKQEEEEEGTLALPDTLSFSFLASYTWWGKHLLEP